MEEDLELWKNNGAGNIVVVKRGEYGVITDEMVQGGRTLHITKTDRKMNQERAANANLDVFQNGAMAPIKLGDSAAEFAQNPNLLTETDMRALVKSHPKTFEKRLEDITNPVVVAKILEIAREEDCTVRRVEAIEARLEDVNPINTVKIKSHAPDERDVGIFSVSKT